MHLNAREFNAILDDPNTIVVDFRNHYESEVGHFTGAITPDVETFRESLPIINEQLKDFKEDKNLVMYCTGGIRCEKASAYYKHQGFKNVFQLEGGIINYAKQIKEEGLESKFIGKNFVFDHRLGERITDDIIAQCHQCGEPCDTHVNCANEACHLLFIQCDSCAEKMENCCSTTCVETIYLPLEEQEKLRKGVKNGNMIFQKGKSPDLKFKQSSERNIFEEIAQKPVKVSAVTQIRKRKIATERKLYIGKGQHYFSKAQVGQFLIEKEELKTGDTIYIIGPTTGNQKIEVGAMFVNGAENSIAKSGDKVTFVVPFKIRESDKIYKI